MEVEPALFFKSFRHPQTVEYHDQYLNPNVIEGKILADKMAQAVVIDDGDEAVDRRPAVSYTHLTLPTILRV